MMGQITLTIKFVSTCKLNMRVLGAAADGSKSSKRAFHWAVRAMHPFDKLYVVTVVELVRRVLVLHAPACCMQTCTRTQTPAHSLRDQWLQLRPCVVTHVHGRCNQLPLPN